MSRVTVSAPWFSEPIACVFERGELDTIFEALGYYLISAPLDHEGEEEVVTAVAERVSVLLGNPLSCS